MKQFFSNPLNWLLLVIVTVLIFFLALATSAGLGACWSQPILASDGRVLGTFAIYHRTAHTPADQDIYLIEQCASLASIALEKNLAEERLQRSEAHFRLAPRSGAGSRASDARGGHG